MLATGRMLAGLAFDWTDSNLTYGICLAIVLLLGAAAVALVKRWQKQGTSETMSPSQQLAEYRSLYDQGLMSKDEFDRLRALLGGQLREMKTTAPTAMLKEPNTAIQDEPVPQPPPTNANGIANPPTPEAGDRPT